MAEQSGSDKYIKCSRCKCKYINDDDSIKTDFGFNRLNVRFKTCVKCRTKTVKVKADKEQIPVVTLINNDKDAYELLFKTLDITCKNIQRDIIFDINNLIERYGDDGYGDKPESMNRITYWSQHLDLTKYLK